MKLNPFKSKIERIIHKTDSEGYTDVSDNPPEFSLHDIQKRFARCKYYSSSEREYILDPDGMTILLFLKDEKGQKIYSPRSKQELARTIMGVKEIDPDAHAYLSSVLQLPSPSIYDVEAFENEKQQYQIDQQKLNLALNTTISYSQENIDQDKTIGALQGEYAIADANAEKNIIGTFGANPCVIVFCRRPAQKNPETREMMPARAAVAHLDATTNIYSLNNFMGKLNSAEPLDVTLISGGFDRRNILRILNFFSDKNVQLKTDIENGTQDAVMVIETGEIVREMPKDNGQNVKLRMSLAGLKGPNGSLGRAYDGTNKKYDIQLLKVPAHHTCEAAPG